MAPDLVAQPVSLPAPTESEQQPAWRGALGSALAVGIFAGGTYLLRLYIEEQRKLAARAAAQAAIPNEEPIAPKVRASSFAGEDDADDDSEVGRAASLLGVTANASADDIRRALRRKMTETGAHPDHGGDHDTAADLVAAKNLLFEHVRKEASRG